MRNEEKLVDDVLNVLNKNDNVVSASIVGSIVNKSFDEISDIDIVVILDKISKSKIDYIKNCLKMLDPKKYGLLKSFEINDTFGPLKMETKDTLVFHLMIYDITSHTDHALDSPFTCYDWERSEKFVKHHISSVYPVRKLMISDFFNSRRGILDYVSDLENQRISYRRYVEKEGELVQEKDYFELDGKHLTEYSFHIIKNLINNFIKNIENKNFLYEDKLFLSKWKQYLPDTFKNFNDIYIDLKNKKQMKIHSEINVVTDISNFLKDYFIEVNNIYLNSRKIILIRHSKTLLNDGSFLGQKRDPSIDDTFEFNNKIYDLVFDDYKTISSPLKRAKETLNHLGIDDFQLDDRLKEFNYGKAEGMFFDDITSEFPFIEKDIKNQLDFRFPEGENYTDLLLRMNDLLSENNDDLILLTHQGPIRAIIGSIIELPIHLWHQIEIPYTYPIEIIYLNEIPTLNIDRKKFRELFKNFEGM